MKLTPNQNTGTDGRHCPKCGKDIGVLAVMRAGMPSSIRCPHCHARVRYVGTAVVVVVVVMTVIAAFVFAFRVAEGIQRWVVLVVVALLIEYAAAQYLRRRHVLQVVE